VHLVRVRILLLKIGAFGLHKVLFQAGTEIAHADECVDDGQDDENDGHDSKRSERTLNRHVVLCLGWLVHPHKLVKEVGQSTKVEQNDQAHAGFVLAAGEVAGGYQNGDGDWYGGDGETEFDTGFPRDDDQKLNGKTEKEEEVELDEGDVNLHTSAVSPRKPAEGKEKLTWK